MSSGVLNAIGEAHEPDDDSPFICEFGRVAEVEAATLRIKAIIPSIDKHHVHDQWIAQMVPWVGAVGFGPVCAPAVGSEVLITGRYGDTLTLYYTSVFNERHTVPEDFADGSRGLKTETPYKVLADLFIELISQQRIRVEGADLAEVVGAVVKLLCGGSEVLRGESGKIGFLGAAATGKKTLPAPASDLATCIALANALRAHEIERGLGQ